MATLTRLASTLTARYFPSSTLTDAFYLDGRLCGKRETRQADITIDKDERGLIGVFSMFFKVYRLLRLMFIGYGLLVIEVNVY